MGGEREAEREREREREMKRGSNVFICGFARKLSKEMVSSEIEKLRR